MCLCVIAQWNGLCLWLNFPYLAYAAYRYFPVFPWGGWGETLPPDLAKEITVPGCSLQTSPSTVINTTPCGLARILYPVCACRANGGFILNKFAEQELREKFELDRVHLLAGRLLGLTGARFMVISLDNNENVCVSCSSGWLTDISDFVGDALAEASDLDAPLSQLV